MRVGVIGTGHVGLPTAAVLARLGHDVVATDRDADRLAGLRRGEAPFYEPGLPELLAETTASGALRFADDIADVVADRDVVLICVGTAPRTTGAADPRAVSEAIESVRRHARKRIVVVEKGTVPTGTADRLAASLAGSEIAVVSNPEFLREGSAIVDLLEPSHIVVGAAVPWAFDAMRELYRPFIDRAVPYIETDLRTAELSKLAANAFLAMKVSFANALAGLSERVGVDVRALTHIVGLDPRIGHGHLRAGLGFGGSCFPKDLAQLGRIGEEAGHPFALLEEISRLNREALARVERLVLMAAEGVAAPKVALLGLAFKPGTDDVRFAPALELAQRLLDRGIGVTGFDPQAGENAATAVPGLDVADTAYSAVQGAVCAVVCTEWPEIVALDFAKVRELMDGHVIVDARNALDERALRDAGLRVVAPGRPETA